jgi:hypothetical protein
MTDKGIALVDGADGLTRIVEAFVARLREQVNLDAQRRGDGDPVGQSFGSGDSMRASGGRCALARRDHWRDADHDFREDPPALV